jgi:hypothetical protein
VVPSGNNLTFNVKVTFGAAFAGARNIWSMASDSALASNGWVSAGTWTVGPRQDYTLGGTPAGRTVLAGQTATYTLTLTPINGLDVSGATFQVTGLPSNATATPSARRVAYGPTEGMVDSAGALKAAVGAYVDDDVLPLVAANQRSAGQWQPRVERGPEARFHSAAFVNGLPQEVLRSADAQVGVVRDLECADARAFRETAPRVRLDAPCDAAEQELLVIRTGVLAEGLAVPFLELRGGQAAEALDLFSDSCWIDCGFVFHVVN